MRLEFLIGPRSESLARWILEISPDAGEFFHDGERAPGCVHGRVATFVAKNQLSAAQIGGGAFHYSRHFPVGFAVAHHPCERIHRTGVESARNEDNFRTIRVKGGNDDLLHCLEVCAMAAAGRQRHVDVEAGAGSCAGLLDRAGARRIVSRLMNGDRQNTRIVIKRVLSLIAVVDVPIDDGNPTHPACGLSPPNRDWNVAQNAESPAMITRCMMTCGPYERIDVVHSSVEDG